MGLFSSFYNLHEKLKNKKSEAKSASLRNMQKLDFKKLIKKIQKLPFFPKKLK